MNRKSYFILVIFFVSFSAYSQNIDSTLHKAYKYNSKIILDEFFMNWENSNKLRDDEIPLNKNTNDTLKEIYEIVNTFYNPVSGEAKYFILEDTLRYKICYSDTILFCYSWRKSILKSYDVTPFRLENENTKPELLYLNNKYCNTVLDFFKCPYTDLKKVKVDYDSKIKFLEGYIKFINRGNFQVPYISKSSIISDSHIENIVIYKDLDKAMVGYSTQCAYTEDEWAKINGKWRYVRTISVDIC